MAPKFTQDGYYDPTDYDPTTAIRNQVINQVASDPAATDPSQATSSAPVPSADFNQFTPAGAPTQSNPAPNQPGPTLTAPNPIPADAPAPAAPSPSAFTNVTTSGPPLPNLTPGETGQQWVDANVPAAVAAGNAITQPAAQSALSQAWIMAALNAAQSTDDPNYWFSKVAADPKAMAGDQSAIAYWQGRIAQGNGALAVRNGTTALYNDGGTTKAPTGNPVSPAYTYTPTPGSPSGTAGGLTVPAGLWSPDFLAQLRASLMSRIQGDSAPVNESDPALAQPLSAARDELSRQSTTERAQLAENLYAKGGLNTDAVTQGIQQSNERNATSLSSLRANLITSELTRRQADLQNLMSVAVQSGDAESAQAIQLQLAALQAELTREGYGVTAGIAAQQFNNTASTAVTG